jgi:hypothetical protein
MHLGDTWGSLAELEMERTGNRRQIIPRASGRTILFSGSTSTQDSSEGSPTELWIISLAS